MNIVDVLRVLRNNRWVILACVALGTLLGVAYSLLQPVLYTATSTGLVVVQGEATLSGTETAQTRAKSYLPLINSRTVREKVSQATGTDPAAAQLKGAVVPDSNLIQVTGTASSPEEAARIANSALVATAEVANDLDPESNVRVTAMEDALPPGAPSSPDYVRNALYGLAAGLLAGVAIAFLRRVVDVNVRTTKDAQEAAGTGLLGAVPQEKSLDTGKDGAHKELAPRAAEAIRQLRTNLRFVGVDNPPRSIAFTSSNPGEGKSTVLSNLALAIAASGRNVVLIDADLRRPRQATLFDVSNRVGLSEVLVGEAELDDAIREVGGHGLLFLPSGRTPPNPSEQLGSDRMRELIAELSKTHLVLIDAPPVLPVTDSTLLATAVDGTVLVVLHGKTRKDHLEVARDMLGTVNATVLGVVVNGVPASGLGADYYGGGYGATGDAYDKYYDAPYKAAKSKPEETISA